MVVRVNETNHSQCTLVVVNEIDSLIMTFMTFPTRVRVHERLDRGLGLNSGLACHFLLNFQARISALFPLLKVSNTMTRLAVDRSTLAVSPQNGTKKRLQK